MKPALAASDSGALIDRVRASALHMLTRREHSAVELRTKLTARFSARRERLAAGDHPAEDLDQAITHVLARLVESGLQSDQRFAEALGRSRQAGGYGPYYIQRELVGKGVAAHLAKRIAAGKPADQNDDQDLIDEQPETDWAAQAREVIERRYPRAWTDTRDWQRAARFLERRGFSGEVMRAVLGRPPRDPSLQD